MNRNTKPLLLLIGSILLAILLSGCARSYAVKIEAGRELIESCPTHASAGETVTIRTVSITDAELRVTVNGSASGGFIEESVYQFIMPSQDAAVRVSISTDGYPGA